MGSAMLAMGVMRLCRRKLWPGVFSKISESLRLTRGAGGMAEAGPSVRRAEARVARGATVGGLRLAGVGMKRGVGGGWEGSA